MTYNIFFRKGFVAAVATLAILGTTSEAQALLLVEQWTNGGTGGISGAEATIFSGAADISVLTDIIDYSDHPIDGAMTGSSQWPLAIEAGYTGWQGVNDTFVARISGQFYVDVADMYSFRSFNDDGMRLKINGSDLLVDNSYHPANFREANLFLVQGWHSLDALFFEYTRSAIFELTARQGSGAFGHIGSVFETRPTEVPAPAAVLPVLGSMLAAARRRKHGETEEA